jgi:hypothetical protein
MKLINVIGNDEKLHGRQASNIDEKMLFAGFSVLSCHSFASSSSQNTV